MNKNDVTDLEWRPVSGYESLYEVSNTGLVRSHDRLTRCCGGALRKIAGKILSTKPTSSNGYPKVGLHRDASQEYKDTHRLVAEAFLPRIEGKNQVNHKNADKTDNRASNLEWVDSLENMAHASSMGLLNNKPMAMTQEEVSKAIDLRRSGLSFVKIAKEFGISETTVRKACDSAELRGIISEADNRNKNKIAPEVEREIVRLRNEGIPFASIGKTLCVSASSALRVSRKYAAR